MYANQTDLVTRHILPLCMFLIFMEENKLFCPAQLKLNKGTYCIFISIKWLSYSHPHSEKNSWGFPAF